MSKYAGKKAVVTGGTHGIGLATVKALLEGGAEVLLTGRNERNLEAARRLGFQKPYLRRWLNFIGVTDIQEINVAPTLANPDVIGRVKCKTKRAAFELAAAF